MKVTVVGGGISGLAAAWELSSNAGVEVTVRESADRLGGKIQRSEFAGAVVDEGADAFLRRVPDATTLCAELGLTELMFPATSAAMVWADGRLHRFPGGTVLGVPVTFDDLDASEVLSPAGRDRARQEPDLPGTPVTADCTIGELITRRYGREVTDRLVGPLIGGINAGAIDEMSVDAIAPQLAAAARRSASLSTALGDAATLPSDDGPVFAAPPGGMGALIERLAERLTERGVHFQLSAPVTSLDEFGTDAPVVITTPPHITARLLEPIAPGSSQMLADIPLASVVFTALAFRRDDLPAEVLDPQSSGFVIPRGAGFTITAATFLSTKWPHLGGEHVFYRASVGHSADTGAIDLPDEVLIDRILADFETILGIDAQPAAVRIVRYRDAFPQYTVGHLERIDALERELFERAPHVAVCGMAHRGVGIPACIREARRAARNLLDHRAGIA